LWFVVALWPTLHNATISCANKKWRKTGAVVDVFREEGNVSGTRIRRLTTWYIIRCRYIKLHVGSVRHGRRKRHFYSLRVLFTAALAFTTGTTLLYNTICAQYYRYWLLQQWVNTIMVIIITIIYALDMKHNCNNVSYSTTPQYL
jgi:hypothetical protein